MLMSSPTDSGLPTANVSFPDAVAFDNSMVAVTIGASVTSGSLFDIGDTDVYFVATDDSGNTNDCVLIISVIGNVTSSCQVIFSSDRMRVRDCFSCDPQILDQFWSSCAGTTPCYMSGYTHYWQLMPSERHNPFARTVQCNAREHLFYWAIQWNVPSILRMRRPSVEYHPYCDRQNGALISGNMHVTEWYVVRSGSLE